jgi:hypothetical protein
LGRKDASNYQESEQKYIVMFNGSEKGPFDDSQMQRFISSSEIVGKTAVRLSETTDWKKVSDFFDCDAILRRSENPSSSAWKPQSTYKSNFYAAALLTLVLFLMFLFWYVSNILFSLSAFCKSIGLCRP